MKNSFSINFLWWIENNEKWLPITGSSTLMTIDLWWQKIRILTDIWMFQWWKNDDEMNKKMSEEAKKADYIILTHAHMDHVWRLPMIIKAWFKWKIISTAMTKDLVYLMLNDYVSLTRRKIEEQEEIKKRRWKKFNTYLKCLKLYKRLKEDRKLKKSDKEAIENKINKNNDTWFETDEFIEYISKKLEENNIHNRSDIQNAISYEDIELLYDEDDIEKTMLFFETLEIWEEKNLDNRIFIENINDPIIDKIPELIKSWYNKKIYVLPHIKSQIIARWRKILDDIKKFNKENKLLRRELEQSFNFINRKENSGSDLFEFHLKKLEKYGITSKDDLDKLKFEAKLYPFSKEDIEVFSNYLVPIFKKAEEKVVKNILLNFFEAWHIAWSIQAQITITTQKVKKILWQSSNYNKQYEIEDKNIIFSWDLWKITEPNLSGSPVSPKNKIDFWIFESTYAWKNHPNKISELNRFITLLNSTKWKAIIHAFSLDRSQEIEFAILKNILENLDLYKRVQKYKKTLNTLKKQIKKLENSKNLNEEEQEEKIRIENVIFDLNNLIQEAENKVYTWNILFDSPLRTKIRQVYLKYDSEKYFLLDKNEQIRIFWKEMVKDLERWEYKSLYTKDRINSKDTIIVWWWMAQWGSWINHLKENLENPNSSVFFVWYQAKWTLWYELTSWKKQVIIEWKIYNVRCQIYQIWWFSSHIWHSDLIDYLKNLNLSKNAKIVLNHWWKNRQELTMDLKRIRKKITTILPEVWDEITNKL